MKYVISLTMLALGDIIITQYGLRSGLAVEANPVMATVIHLIPFNVLKIYLTYLASKSIFAKETVLYENLNRMNNYDVSPDIKKFYLKGVLMTLRTKLITIHMMVFVIIWNILVIATVKWFVRFQYNMLEGAYLIYMVITVLLLFILIFNIYNVLYRRYLYGRYAVSFRTRRYHKHRAIRRHQSYTYAPR